MPELAEQVRTLTVHEVAINGFHSYRHFERRCRGDTLASSYCRIVYITQTPDEQPARYFYQRNMSSQDSVDAVLIVSDAP